MKKQPRHYQLFGCGTALLLCLQQAGNLLLFEKSQSMLITAAYYLFAVLSLFCASSYAALCIKQIYLVEVIPIIQTGLAVVWYALLTQSGGNAALQMTRVVGLVTVMVPLLLHIWGNNKRVYTVSNKEALQQ